jgi:chemotaxis-related protein WspB
MLLLTFSAGPNRYAIDVNWIVELVPKVELRSVPHAPPYLSGLLGYRGSVLPVIDFAVLLGLEPCQDRLSTRIILVSDCRQFANPAAPLAGSADPDTATAAPTSPLLLGLMAAQVSELDYVRTEDLIPAPVQLPNAPYLIDVVKTARGIVQMIDVAKLRSACHFSR